MIVPGYCKAVVFHSLRELGGVQSVACLAQFVEEQPGAVEGALEELCGAGYVLVENSARTRRYAAAPAASLPLPEGGAGAGDLADCFAARRDGRELDACAALLVRMDRYLAASSSLAAVACLELAIRYLREWAAAVSGGADTRRFLELVLAIADTAMYLTKHLAEALELTARARAMAKGIGDGRTEFLLGLVEACLENMHAECSAARLQELRRQWTKSLAEFDDADITARLHYFSGMFHFWEGNFTEVLDAFAGAAEHPRMWRGRFQTEMFPLYTSSSALYLGRFHQAVGILEAARRAAELRQNRFKTLWWEAQLAMVLLYMNRCEEALELFDHVIAEANPESETKILAWGMRGLAYYHWRKGNAAFAHRALADAMATARRYGMRRPIYSYPWMFDVLYAFEQAGLPPVQGLCLEDELAHAMEGPNKHLQAGALRTIARLRLAEGYGLEDALACLAESRALFDAVGNPVESARTRLCIADALVGLGKEAEGKALRTEAENVLARFDQQDAAPLGLGRLREKKPESARRASAAALWSPAGKEKRENLVMFPGDTAEEDLAENCRQAMEALPPLASLDLFLGHMARIACTELGAERAALFSADRGGVMQARARANITRRELDTGVLAARLARIHAGLGLAPVLLEDGGAVSVTMPLKAGKDESWLLYLESTYAVKTLRDLGARCMEDAAAVFSRELRAALRHAAQAPDARAEPASPPAGQRRGSSEMLFHSSASMRRLISQSRQVAITDAPVLILGETGVGKELLAQFIHECSGRAGPFVPVHAASIAESLFESEFFGHEKGAFTGAVKQKAGLAEMAHRGTLFIDEVGDIPLATQVKLLRVFQSRRFSRVGGSVELESDFRLVGATNKDLWQEVLGGRFREDLYYRMSVVPLTLPPLREREEDIPLLAELFLDRYSRRYGRRVPKPGPEELAALAEYPWPGNVRELKSVIERAVILYRGGVLDYGLTRAAQSWGGVPAPRRGEFGLPELAADLPSLGELQRRYVRHVLELTGGKVTGPNGALRILGLKRSTFYARFRQVPPAS